MTRIYLVRHGEIDANVQKRYAGSVDQYLNKTGEEQVQKLPMKLKGIDFDKVYVSPLKRTIQTFYAIIEEPVSEKHPDNIIIEEGIKERNFGIFENLTIDEMKEKYPKEYQNFIDDWAYYQIPEGESAKEAYERVCRAFDKIVEENEGKTILLVTHLGVIRYILAHKICEEMDGLWHFFADNASVTKLEINDGYYTLKGLSM